MQLILNFGDIKDTDPVMIISLKNMEQLDTVGQFFKKAGFEVWKLHGEDLGGDPCFHLAFPLPNQYGKPLCDLVHAFLKEEFNLTTSSTTWKREGWNEVQVRYPMTLEVL